MKTKTNDNTKLTFAEILEDAIKNSRYNNAAIAELLQVSRGTVSNWVNGVRKPDIDKVIQICFLLDVDFYYAIGATMPAGELRPKEQQLLMLYQSLDAKERACLLHLAEVLADKKRKEE